MPVEERTYITVYDCPKEIHDVAKLWKPILNKPMNDIFIEMLTQGIKEMQGAVLELAREKLRPLGEGKKAKVKVRKKANNKKTKKENKDKKS